MPNMTATYSPEDNKLRLYTVARLDSETYARVKAAGFKWAPKQELFVAPMWTPARAELLIELCGEIEDEDKSLVDRAEERADRFEEYSESRAADASAARDAVEQITSGIPLGQPILVGHHSEKRARKDAERIQNGMRKAVQMWETANYWTARAKGAIRHAKYKERPDVRHRRIKGLEADKRKHEKRVKLAEALTSLWSKPDLTPEKAQAIANYDHVYVPGSLMPASPGGYFESLWGALDKHLISVGDAVAVALKHHAATIADDGRWLAHIENRLAYERAMLQEAGGLATERFPIEVGGRVLASHWRARGKGWLVVTRLNKSGGTINSVSTPEGVIEIETIKEYRAPEAGDVDKVKKASKLPPLVNYPGEGFRHMTKAEYDRMAKHTDMARVRRVGATTRWAAHRRREAPQVGRPYYDTGGVYLTDAKIVDPPPASTAPSEEVTFAHMPGPAPALAARASAPRAPTVFDEMKDSLKRGVIVVRAEQLFPTPQPLAARMVEIAVLEPHHWVLEPSAGTGAILREIRKVVTGDTVVCIEINRELAQAVDAHCADFLTLTATGLGTTFDRILMNPPFANGQDIEHVMHAFTMLAVGGVLVAIMSAGTKFRSDRKATAFRALVDEHGEMEDLPEDTFKDQGTGVRTVLVTLRK